MLLSDETGALDLHEARRFSPAAAPAPQRRIPARFIAAGIVALLLAASWGLLGVLEEQAPQLQLSLLLGAFFGFTLQRSRFCFFCLWRDWLDRRGADGLIGLFAALAVGAAGYALIFGAWLPDPSGSRLPPTAHIGPVGPALVVAGLSFGAGMAISGSCVSAHLYRLGEGSPVAPFALVGGGAGFILGFLSWNDLYLWTISDSPTIWLPRHLGYAGWLAATLALLGLAAWAASRNAPQTERAAAQPFSLDAVFTGRWPAWIGGLFVGAIGVASYFRLGPLGVTAEIGSRSRQLASAFDLLPERLEGLDTLRGCATVIRNAILTPNGVFIAGLIAASFAAALASDSFRPHKPTPGQIARGLLGGLLLGWGSAIGLGCTVGTLLSGISGGAASGWVFAFGTALGATVTLRSGRRFGVLA